jgi:hypothetical protein
MYDETQVFDLCRGPGTVHGNGSAKQGLCLVCSHSRASIERSSKRHKGGRGCRDGALSVES